MLKRLRSVLACRARYSIFVLAFLSPTACQKQPDSTLTPTPSATTGSLNVSLPTGTKFKADELTIITSSGQASVKNGIAQVQGLAPSNQSLLIAEHPSSGLTLFSFQLRGETQFELSASSTALALLMINPLTPNLSPDDAKRLANFYKGHALFAQLVKEVETFIVQDKSYLASSNKVFQLINQIHGSPVNIGGRSGSQLVAVVGDHIALADPILKGNQLTLQNKASFLPHVAGVYDESGKLLEVIDLGNGEIVNTNLIDLFKDAVLGIKDLPNCFDLFGTRPTPDCPKKDKLFFSPKIPDPVVYVFPKDGKYTVKVINVFGSQAGTEKLLQKASLNTGLTIFWQLLAVADRNLASKARSQEACLLSVMGEYFYSLFKAGVLSSKDRNFTAVVNDIISSIAKRSIDFAKCFSASEISYMASTASKFESLFKYIQVFGSAGASANLIGLGINFAIDKAYYEYHYEVKNNVASSLSPEGMVKVEEYCVEEFSFAGGVSNYAYGWGYTFSLFLKDEYKSFPHRTIYLITPDEKYYLELEVSQKNVASFGYYTQILQANTVTNIFPYKYDIATLLAPADNIKSYPLRTEASGLFKLMVVFSDDEKNYIKSKTVSLPQAINTEDYPCDRSGSSVKPKLQPFTVSF